MAILAEYAKETSFHGLVHIVRSTSKVIKIIWIVIIVLCITVLVFQIYCLLNDYTDVHSKWTTSIYDELVDSLPVPVITVCNYNRIKKSKAVELNMTRNSTISLFRRFLMNYPSNVDVSAEMDDEFEQWKTENNIKTNSEVLEKLGPQCNETIVEAFAYYTGSAICDAKVPSSEMIVVANPVNSLDMGRCYQMTIKDSSIDFKTGGAHESVTIIFDTLIDEYISKVHNNFYDGGLAIQFSVNGFGHQQMCRLGKYLTGSLTRIMSYTYSICHSILEKLELGRWEELKNGQQIWLGGRVSKSKTKQVDTIFFNPPCIKDSKLEMFPDMVYTMDLCKMDLYYSRISAVVNCTYLLIDSPKYPQCNFSNDQFYSKLDQILKSKEAIKNFYATIEKDIKEKCKEPCEATFIETTITASQFPTLQQEAELIKQFSSPERNLTIGDIGRRLISLTMYWKSFTIRVLERHEKTTIEDLISNIGSQLGLWLGGSVLTITHALLYICGTRATKEKNKEQICLPKSYPKYVKDQCSDVSYVDKDREEKKKRY